jgi:hypothetical protein
MNPDVKKVLQVTKEESKDLPRPEASELCDEELDIISGAVLEDGDFFGGGIPITNCCLGRRG